MIGAVAVLSGCKAPTSKETAEQAASAPPIPPKGNVSDSLDVVKKAKGPVMTTLEGKNLDEVCGELRSGGGLPEVPLTWWRTPRTPGSRWTGETPWSRRSTSCFAGPSVDLARLDCLRARAVESTPAIPPGARRTAIYNHYVLATGD